MLNAMKNLQLEFGDQDTITAKQRTSFLSRKPRHSEPGLLKQNTRINVKVTEDDLTLLKSQALKLGVPYQSLISSVIRQYLSQQK